jgi:hypothetical protein
MFTSLLTGDHNDELRDLGLLDPLVELAHDLLDISLDLVIQRNHHVQAILLDAGTESAASQSELLDKTYGEKSSGG